MISKSYGLAVRNYFQLFQKSILYVCMVVVALGPGASKAQITQNSAASVIVLNSGSNEILLSDISDLTIMKLWHKPILSHLYEYYYFVYASLATPGDVSDHTTIIVPIVEQDGAERDFVKTTTLSEHISQSATFYLINKDGKKGIVLMEINDQDDGASVINKTYSLCNARDVLDSPEELSFIYANEEKVSLPLPADHDYPSHLHQLAEASAKCLYQ
jgi:hypothetical protein